MEVYKMALTQVNGAWSFSWPLSNNCLFMELTGMHTGWIPLLPHCWPVYYFWCLHITETCASLSSHVCRPSLRSEMIVPLKTHQHHSSQNMNMKVFLCPS